MPAVRLGLSAYQRLDLPYVTLKNLFYEQTPANLTDQVSILPRPRTKLFSSFGTGPIRGMYREGGVVAGRIIALSGTQLYSVVQDGQPGAGTATLIGSVEGTGRMSAEGAPLTVVLTMGTKVYKTDGVTVDQIAIPDNLNINATDTLDQRFIFACDGSNKFFWTDAGGFTVDTLAFANAESQPDILITLKVIDDVLWLVGRLSLEAWRGTGDLDLPYERIEGRVFGIGCTARDTCQKMNVDGKDTMAWVGTDRKVYRLQPNPVRISDFGMEERLARATPESLYAQVFSWNGHDFYMLHIPGEGSFVYDFGTGFWDEWTSYAKSLFTTGVSTVGVNGAGLLGDNTTNAVYLLSMDSIADHTAKPVVFEFTGIIQDPGLITNLQLGCSTGSTDDPEADPMMQLAVSDDEGATWDEMPDQPLLRQGNRAQRVMWTRLGRPPQDGSSVRLLRFRSTEPVTVTNATYNEAYR